MSCTLNLGRKEPCKDVVGGIKNVYFVDFGDISPVYDSTDTDVVDSVGSAVASYKYELKGNSSFEQAITSSRENGTTFFEQTLNLTLKKLTKEDNKELKLLAYGRPHVLIEDYNSNVFIMGLKNGAELSGGSVVTGASMADLSGYTLSFSAQETEPANFIGKTAVDETVSTTLTNAGFAAPTEGTNV